MEPRPLHHRRLCAAWLHVIVGSALMFGVCVLWLCAAGLAPLFEGSFVPELFAMFGRPIAIALMVFASLEILSAFGLMRGRRWAVRVLVGITVVQFTMVPLGTALAVFTWWAMLSPGRADALPALAEEASA